jgi:hypothetical protein
MLAYEAISPVAFTRSAHHGCGSSGNAPAVLAACYRSVHWSRSVFPRPVADVPALFADGQGRQEQDGEPPGRHHPLARPLFRGASPVQRVQGDHPVHQRLHTIPRAVFPRWSACQAELCCSSVRPGIVTISSVWSACRLQAQQNEGAIVSGAAGRALLCSRLEQGCGAVMTCFALFRGVCRRTARVFSRPTSTTPVNSI